MSSAASCPCSSPSSAYWRSSSLPPCSAACSSLSPPPSSTSCPSALPSARSTPFSTGDGAPGSSVSPAPGPSMLSSPSSCSRSCSDCPWITKCSPSAGCTKNGGVCTAQAPATSRPGGG